MNTAEILKTVLKLDPAERFSLVDEILQSLDKPDLAIDLLWVGEAERRLAAHRSGAVKGIPAEDVVDS
jgi:putative addiction module component (TIGR02574 family)